MLSFNNYQLRTDESGKTFVDIDLQVINAPVKTILRLSFPLSPNFRHEEMSTLTGTNQLLFDKGFDISEPMQKSRD